MSWRGRPGFTMPKTGTSRGRDGYPCLPRDRLGEPRGLFRILQIDLIRVVRLACRFASCLPTLKPVPVCRAGPLGDRWRRDTFGRSLTCAGCLSACGWDGVAGLVPTVPSGIAGGVHGTRHGGTGHSDACGVAVLGPGLCGLSPLLWHRFGPDSEIAQSSWCHRGRDAV